MGKSDPKKPAGSRDAQSAPHGIPRKATRKPAAVPFRWPSRLVALAFFLSGAAALLYELLWFRLLGHIFGSTATATATLLAAYLFGLGLGAWIFGRLSDRTRRLASVYIAIEIGIGLYGLASHALLQRSAVLYGAAHAWAAGDAGRLLALRFAISFLLIVVPTTLMGGTFPLMVQMLKSRAIDAGRAAARAYAVNTAGAAVGALSLPILVLPHLGVALSLVLAAGANLAAAACVFVYARRDQSSTAVVAPEGETTRPTPPTAEREAVADAVGRSRGGRLLLGFLLSSFAALSLETVWVRHFGIFFGAQIYTFAFILFAYLVGLFLGGAVYARFAARGVTADRLLRAGFLVAATSVAVTIPFLGRLPVPQIELMSLLGVSNGTFLFTCALETLALILPPALGFGIAFPAVVALLANRGRKTGASVALTYAVNTVGTTLGAIGAGFWLIPAIGSQRTFEFSVLLIAAALVLTAEENRTAAVRSARDRLVTFGIPAVFLLLLVLPRWDWRFAHGMYSKDPAGFVKNYQSGELAEALKTYRVPFLDEGTEATVSVLEFGTQGRRSLFINGKPDASSIPDDMVAQRLIALVPALFHPNPQDALVIGVGSGTTVATLKRFPLARLETAEIAPGVARAARDYFADVNDRFLEDPRVKLLLDDGRNYLQFRPAASYDLIVSEPSNPWTVGVSALFTDEFFAEAKVRLRPGGVLCQWFHYYNMSLEHIQLVVRTFVRNFPETALFVLQGDRPTGDLLLIGVNGPLRLAHLPDDPALPDGVRDALVEIKNATAEQLLRGLAFGPEEVAAFAGPGPYNTDDRPKLEFEAPADRFQPTFVPNLRALLYGRAQVFLPTGPAASVTDPTATTEAVFGDLGLAQNIGPPSGREARRGAKVLTGHRTDPRQPERWVLLGSEYADGERRTGLFRLARAPKDEAEAQDVARVLAGPDLAGEGRITVNGHPGNWVEGDSEDRRIVVCAWHCPEQDRVFFLTQEEAGAGSRPASDLAVELTTRYPCRHRLH